MLEAALQYAIKTAVETRLAPLPVSGVAVVEGEDYDSNDVVLVTVELPEGTGQISGEHLLRAMTAVSEALLRSGDQRMPYFRTLREGEAEPADDQADAFS